MLPLSQISVQLNIWSHPCLLAELERPVDLCNLHAQRLVQLEVAVVYDVALLFCIGLGLTHALSELAHQLIH